MKIEKLSENLHLSIIAHIFGIKRISENIFHIPNILHLKQYLQMCYFENRKQHSEIKSSVDKVIIILITMTTTTSSSSSSIAVYLLQ